MTVQVFTKKKLLFSVVFLLFSLLLVGFDDNGKEKKENVQAAALRVVSECTFVNELVSAGFSGSEALQNIGSCKDRECPYHYPKSHCNIALMK